MSRHLKIGLIQIETEQAAPKNNLERGKHMIATAAKQGAELVILPELWTTGFNWPKNAKMANGHQWIIDEVARVAKKHGLWISGSLLGVNEEKQPTNSQLLFSPDGAIVARYDKVHLFTMTGEDKCLAPGNEVVVYEAPFGKLGLTICYDIRFPELYRSCAIQGAELILCPAGFPNPRQHHWRTLLRARAIENQCFMVACNRVGKEHFPMSDPWSYFGLSSIIDPWGETVVEIGDSEQVITASIDLDKVQEVRSLMKVFRDRRPDVYEL